MRKPIFPSTSIGMDTLSVQLWLVLIVKSHQTWGKSYCVVYVCVYSSRASCSRFLRHSSLFSCRVSTFLTLWLNQKNVEYLLTNCWQFLRKMTGFIPTGNQLRVLLLSLKCTSKQGSLIQLPTLYKLQSSPWVHISHLGLLKHTNIKRLFYFI